MSGYEEGSAGEGSQGPRPPQNVKPKPNQSDQNLNKDQICRDYGRKERPAKVRRSRSSDSERMERGRRSERERHHRERRPRGRSEESRRRVRREGDRRPDEDDQEDTECNVCFCSYDNVFKTPKLLACGHTFCLECLARINVTSQEIKTLTCPMCRELTELPHGRDLPRLGTNQLIIHRLPAEMQRALSIRFKRSKGKLLLKHPPPRGKPAGISVPTKTQEPPPAAVVGGLSLAEQGGVAASVLDVGRPPNRMRGRVRRLFRSDRCYYAVVASIIAITVALMLVGVLAFVIMPRVSGSNARPVANQTNLPNVSGGETQRPNEP